MPVAVPHDRSLSSCPQVKDRSQEAVPRETTGLAVKRPRPPRPKHGVWQGSANLLSLSRKSRYAGRRPRASSSELARDLLASWTSAIDRNRSLASSRGIVGLRLGLLRLELVCDPGWDVGAEGVRALILLVRVLGTLGPSRVLPGPLRYCVLLES